jgi:hypothetical protein
MNTPKQQHVIPRVHLQYFTGDSPPGQVWTYDALNSKRWSAAPEETATEGHFYSGERADGTMNTAIEEYLSKIEHAAAPTYAAIVAEGRIPGESQERADFAQFLGLMYSRTRAMRRTYATGYGQFMQTLAYEYAVHPEAFATILRKHEAEIGRELTEEERKSVKEWMMDPTKIEMVVAKEATLEALPVADMLSEMFFHMRWWVMSAAEGYFVTSDNPLVREVDPSSLSPFYGDGGFRNPTAEVTFPLSPQKLLLMTWRNVEYRVAIAGDAVVKANEARAAHSDQYLYAHVSDDGVAALAQRFRDSRPAVRLSGFGPEKFGDVRVARRARPVPPGKK